MTTFPAAAYLSDAARTQAEMKDALEAFLAAAVQFPGGQAESTLTIASGAVTPTRGLHAVDTEAAAVTDDLGTIAQTNFDDGRLLLLRCVASGRTVVVKHAAGGAGQIAIADAADLSLADPSQWLLLRRNGSQWDEVGRHYGNQKAALRARYDLATLTAAVNAFTKRQEWAKGADLASPAGHALTLGTDGNYFKVTGTNGITSIVGTGVATGAVIRLEFAGILILTHHATQLILQNGVPRATAPGDVMTLLHLGAGNWKEIGWHPSTAPPGFFGDPETVEMFVEDFLHTASPGGTVEVFSYAWMTGSTVVSGGARTILRAVGDGSNAPRWVLYDGVNNPTKITQVSRNPTLYVKWAQTNANPGTTRIGLGDAAFAAVAGEWTNGIYFRHDGSASIIAVCRAAGAESTLDTGVAAAAGVFHQGRFEVRAAGAAVDVYLDDVFIGTLDTTIPSVALAPEGSSSSGLNGQGHDVDDLVIKQDR